jgi:hypothetical protein
MTATLYRRMRNGDLQKKGAAGIRPQIHDLLDYELLRNKKSRQA